MRHAWTAARRSDGVGWKREFGRLYRAGYGLVCNYVRYRMADDSAAEDAVAEAFCRAARSFGKFDPVRAEFSTWAARIAANCINIAS